MNDDDAKLYFAHYRAEARIESELGEPLNWYNPENKRVCRIRLRSDADLHDRSQWPNYHEWLRVKLEALQRFFGPRIKLLDSAVLRENSVDGTTANDGDRSRNIANSFPI